MENPTRAQMFVSVRALAAQHKLSACDASYLELAVRHNLPIALSDKALTKTAGTAGINLIEI